MPVPIIYHFPYFSSGFSLSRLYTCRALADFLLRNRMTILGTMKMNRRGIPPELKDVQARPVGDYMALYEKGGKMSLHSFLDKSKKGRILSV
jgi:hypothetical protein